MLRYLSQLWKHQYWRIGLVHQPVHRFLDSTFTPDIEWFAGPTFAADPMIVEHQGCVAVLYEEFDYQTHRGRISAVEIDDGHFGRVHRNVIEDAFHFSYPLCLHVGSELYCIPEHNQSGRLTAWHCERFPDIWTRDRDLLDVPAVDPTIFFHNDCWWMFCTRQDRGPNLHLFLYQADFPLGPWRPYSPHPVKSTDSGARPAGPVFTHDQRLFRPTQDCARSYGGAILFQEIDELSAGCFRETTVGRIDPFPDFRCREGIHHIAGLGNLTVLDGCARIYSPHETLHVLRRWSGRLRGR